MIRVKVNSNSNNGGLIELNVTSGGAILETRTITANMFERAGVYQTFGLNVELNDTVTITARLLKNSANITVSVDYVSVFAGPDSNHEFVGGGYMDISRETCRIAGQK